MIFRAGNERVKGFVVSNGYFHPVWFSSPYLESVELRAATTSRNAGDDVQAIEPPSWYIMSPPFSAREGLIRYLPSRDDQACTCVQGSVPSRSSRPLRTL